MQKYEVRFNNSEKAYSFIRASSREEAIRKTVKSQNDSSERSKKTETDVTYCEISSKVMPEEVTEMLTRSGNYSVDVSWDYIEKNLQNYAEYCEVQLEPEFQRAHVWTEKQQIAYVEYIMRGGQSGRDIYFNCRGWLSHGTEDDPIVLVDGLQRLTAVRKFMRNELKVFGKYYAKDFERISHDWRFKFHINNLETYKEVLKWYLDFNSGGTVHTEEELEKVKKLLEEETK